MTSELSEPRAKAVHDLANVLGMVAGAVTFLEAAGLKGEYRDALSDLAVCTARFPDLLARLRETSSEKSAKDGEDHLFNCAHGPSGGEQPCGACQALRREREEASRRFSENT